MKFYILTVMAIFLMFPTKPAEANACYSNTEAEAEQGLRIHSELMVIGLNCQTIGARHGLNLYGQYRAFTTRHANLFENYEKALLTFYRRRGDGKPKSSLDTLRTKLANKISNDAASMRPDIFCAKYAERIQKAAIMGQTDVRRWAATFYPSHPVSYPFCEG